MENCQHKNGTKPDWTYSTCKDCGSVLTDGGWGLASHKWFRNLAEAKFYKEHGRFSDGEELAQLRASHTAALEKIDQLEAQVCVYERQLAVLIDRLGE